MIRPKRRTTGLQTRSVGYTERSLQWLHSNLIVVISQGKNQSQKTHADLLKLQKCYGELPKEQAERNLGTIDTL